MSREVVVVSAVRTAIGTFGGGLKDVPPCDLGASVVREVLARGKVGGEDVGHVVFGHVVNTEPRDMYLSRVAALQGGCGQGTPAFNVNRLCGSGLQAIISAAQAIGYGDCDVAVGGGSESMSRGPYFDTAARYGARMGDAKSIDYMLVGSFKSPFLLRGGPKETDANAAFDLDYLTGKGEESTDEVQFWLMVPKATAEHKQPFDVNIYGHGYTGNFAELVFYAGNMAEHGLATIGINAMGHGFVIDEVQQLLGTAPRARDLLIEHLHALNDAYRGLFEWHLVALAARDHPAAPVHRAQVLRWRHRRVRAIVETRGHNDLRRVARIGGQQTVGSKRPVQTTVQRFE